MKTDYQRFRVYGRNGCLGEFYSYGFDIESSRNIFALMKKEKVKILYQMPINRICNDGGSVVYENKEAQEVKYWKCPKCAFLTTNEEMQSIVFEPKCRCYNRTGMTWGNFVPVIEERGAKKKIKKGVDNPRRLGYIMPQQSHHRPTQQQKQGGYKMKTGKNLTAKSYHHAGSFGGCIALNAHDIGRAIVNGKSVWFAWGSNLDEGEAKSIRETGVDTVQCGKFAAPVIPLATMARLSQIIIWDNGRDRAILARQIKAQS